MVERAARLLKLSTSERPKQATNGQVGEQGIREPGVFFDAIVVDPTLFTYVEQVAPLEIADEAPYGPSRDHQGIDQVAYGAVGMLRDVEEGGTVRAEEPEGRLT
jgi:hypothetical protein